jgi:hypothetical protein
VPPPAALLPLLLFLLLLCLLLLLLWNMFRVFLFLRPPAAAHSTQHSQPRSFVYLT